MFGFLTWASKPDVDLGKGKEFTLKIFPKDKGSIQDIEEVVQKEGYTSKVKRVTKNKKAKIGYKVVFYLDNSDALSNMMDRLKSKNVKSEIKKDMETGELYIQGYGNIIDKKEAEAKAKNLYNLTLWKFSVKENFKEEHVAASAIVIDNVDERDVEGIKKAVTNFIVEPVEMIAITNIKPPVDKKKETPKQVKKGAKGTKETKNK
jgi:hypothetical protein